MYKTVRTYYAFILISMGLLTATSAQASCFPSSASFKNIDLDSLLSTFEKAFTKENFQLTTQTKNTNISFNRNKDAAETNLFFDFRENEQNVTGVLIIRSDSQFCNPSCTALLEWTPLDFHGAQRAATPSMDNARLRAFAEIQAQLGNTMSVSKGRCDPEFTHNPPPF